MSDEVDFLHAGKYESLLQIDSNDFDGSSIPRVPSIASLQCLYNISKKKLKMKLIFWIQINIKVSQKFISTLWVSKFPIRLKLSLLMDMIKHFQINQSYKFAISLQYLKKEVMNGGHFWHGINVKVSTSLYYPFWWRLTDVFKISKIGIWQYFCNILKIVTTALCSTVMQDIQIFYRGLVLFVVTCFWLISQSYF